MDNRSDDQRPKLPLHAEAIARAKWRGGETLLEGDENDLASPSRGSDDARSVTASEADDDGRPGGARPGNLPPPD